MTERLALLQFYSKNLMCLITADFTAHLILSVHQISATHLCSGIINTNSRNL